MKLSIGSLSVTAVLMSTSTWCAAQHHQPNLRGLAPKVEAESPTISPTHSPTVVFASHPEDKGLVAIVDNDADDDDDARASPSRIMPYDKDCVLGMGHSIANGCGATALDNGHIGWCDDGHPEPCYWDDRRGRDEVNYSRTAESTQETASTLKTAATVEGRFAGFKACNIC